MLVCEDGRTVGSLSAGCIENEVALCAREVLRSGVSTTMSFDTRRRFGCNGKIDIFIERVPDDFLIKLAEHLNARRSCLVVTTFEGTELGSRVSPFVDQAGAGVLVQEIQRVFAKGSGQSLRERKISIHGPPLVEASKCQTQVP